jgi:hypothetical protein
MDTTREKIMKNAPPLYIIQNDRSRPTECALCGTKMMLFTGPQLFTDAAGEKAVCDRCGKERQNVLASMVHRYHEKQTEDAARVLEKYAGRPLRTFVQVDGWAGWDNGIDPDPRTPYPLCGGTTRELMHGSDVRLLIRPDTTRSDVFAILDKMREWLAEEEEWPPFDSIHSPPDTGPYDAEALLSKALSKCPDEELPF